ncbi:MAG: bifunctional glutamate N-acetyltransferase/amino-acid acetyltransferase ArgJ [Pseudomonadota bacterium]
MADALPVSPLAPAGGFQDLPEVPGVRFASHAAGIKYQGRDDVMLAEVAAGCTIAGVFTQSATRAAPVLWCQDCLAQTPDPAKGVAILVNSGNANAFTGRSGMQDVEAIASAVAGAMALPPHHVYMASTGVIGEPLPATRITDAIATLIDRLSPSATGAAAAIMTTDTFPKGASAQVDLGGETVTIAGFAKGSGMIAPDMATMLGYVFTDARVPQPLLQSLLAETTGQSFNAITVDSDTSTSDTVMLAATGQTGPALSADHPALPAFRAALLEVMQSLAHQIVRDGEGASKFITIRVDGATTDTSAQIIAKAIANSPLVKTAIAGEDPNWGRIVMAIGKAGEPADRDRISIHFGDIEVARDGWVSPDYTEAAGASYMKRTEIDITVALGVGEGAATIWTCDLTHQYITINADYRS